MWIWLVTWATAEPLEAMAVGVSLLAAIVAVVCAVAAYREREQDRRHALTHADDLAGEYFGAHRW